MGRGYEGFYQQETPQEAALVQSKGVEPMIDPMKTNKPLIIKTILRSAPQMENIEE